jgi:hypothetical protein
MVPSQWRGKNMDGQEAASLHGMTRRRFIAGIPAALGDAIRTAVRAKSDGVFLYCYGWSTLDNLDAAGRTLRSLGLA